MKKRISLVKGATVGVKESWTPMPTSGEPLSLYFHIPFCTKKCPYCHFYVLPNQERFHTLLLDGLQMEWQQNLPLNHPIRTIYFGGGTPSLLSGTSLERILNLVRSTHAIDDIEITLEANPEMMTEEKLKELFSCGINRLSVGVQSFDEKLLATLGRTHSADQAKRAIELAQTAGFENISLDLMYELPHQTMESWCSSLQEASRLPITHISLYNLTIEPHTAFFKYKERLTPHLPNQELSLQMYEEAIRHFTSLGFEHYEISAFAKPGYRSQHNSGYWLGTPFLGFGPSAFSYYEGKRFRNVANINRYHQALNGGESPVDFTEELPFDDRQKELLAINLRLLQGADLKDFPLPQETLDSIEKLISLQLLKRSGSILSLTTEGILLHDSVASELI